MIGGSLRLRLMMIGGAIALAAILAVTLSSGFILHRVNSHSGPAPRETSGVIAAPLAAAYARRRSWTGAADLLRKVRDGQGLTGELLLVGPQATLIAASSLPPGRTRLSQQEDGALLIESVGGGWSSRTVIEQGSIPIVVDGRRVAQAYLLPRETDPLPRFGRNMALVAAVIAVLALIAVALATQMVAKPIEQLGRAARRIRSGGPAEPVPARGGAREIDELAGSFNTMADRIVRTEQLRRNMINDIAHELRTPLTSLRCSIEAIQDKLRTADASTMAGLERDVTLLQRLVDDLQTIALAEARQLPIHLSQVRLHEVVERGASVARARVRVDVPRALTIRADPERLQQIVANLIRNADAHREGGEIRVSATEEGDAVTIIVEDEGSGIDPRDLPYIFDRFYRADASRQRATGGAGLGLAIVKNLVESHGWTIAVESAPGCGTKFTIRTSLSQRQDDEEGALLSGKAYGL